LTRILGIETSCDETSAAVLEGSDDEVVQRSLVILSQDVHRVFGGVVPEIASRAHLTSIVPVVNRALADAEATLDDIDAIAVTYAPGLIGALLVGVCYAKSLAFARGIPVIPVHHMEGHLFATSLEHPDATPPFTALLVSGGHTMLLDVEAWGQYRLLGATRDDAAGEAFDKVAKLLGLPYPGGRHVEALVPAIAVACRSAGVSLGDIEAVAVDVGPGLYTGMRVGIAAAQGLALALAVRVHPVCSLDALGHPFRHVERPVASVVDARRGEVFWAVNRAGQAAPTAACCTPDVLADELAALGACLAVGDGAVRYRQMLEAAGAKVTAAMPSAESVLELALSARAAGDPGLDAAEVEALYLRAPDARANFTVLAGRAGA